QDAARVCGPLSRVEVKSIGTCRAKLSRASNCLEQLDAMMASTLQTFSPAVGLGDV
ncbi:unnamed protein product, partial [Choristocarpus tenellus]